MNIESPVVFLFFNRHWTARRVFEQIRVAKPKHMILVSDGPRAEVPGEKGVVQNLRNEIENMIDWPAKVETDYAPENLGCGRRVASGIESALSRHGRAIIVEDDCLPGLSFFYYCDRLLQHYEHEDRITSISGTYFLGRSCRSTDVGFTNFPCIWGWATWARAWDGYDRELKGWDDSFIDEIDRRGDIPCFMPDEWKRMFEWIVSHSESTWDVQFWFLSLKKRGLSLFPYSNQISNIGAGPAATHTTGTRHCNLPVNELKYKINLPDMIYVDQQYDKYLQEEFYSNKTTWRNVGHKTFYKSSLFWKRLRERLKL